MDKFEEYLVGRVEFVKNMLNIFSKADTSNDVNAKFAEALQIELDTLEVILHHFNLFVKGQYANTSQ